MSGALEYALAALTALAELGRTPIEGHLDTGPEGPIRTWAGEVHAPCNAPILEVPGEFQAAVLLEGVLVGGLDGYHRRVLLPLDAGNGGCLELAIVPFGLMGVPVEVGQPSAWLIEHDPLAAGCAADLEVLMEWMIHAAPSPGWRRALGERLHEVLRPLLRHPVLTDAIRRHADRPGAPAEEAPLRAHLARGDELGLRTIAPDARAAILTAVAEGLDATYSWLSASLPRGPGRAVVLGHAHLDLAWLWPMAETRRKLVRTLANQVALLERYNDWRFVLSSGQYLAWATEEPALAGPLQRAIARERIEPAGALWIESDAELTGPETLLSSLSLGVHMTKRLGVRRPRVAFLPDTFGFAAGLPTILCEAGVELVVTTKLTWNDRNLFPYAEARWVGPDGRTVGLVVSGRNQDGYNAPLTIADLARALAGHESAGGRGPVLYLFGHGDGGGGPDEAMLERLARYRRLPCLPELTDGALDALLPLPADASEIAGELYLERHRATPTQRSATKAAFVEAEALALTADAWSLAGGIDDAPWWEAIARASFHDVLPGSGINDVERDALRELEAAALAARARVDDAARQRLPTGDEALVVVNPTSRSLPSCWICVEGPDGEEVHTLPALAPFEAAALSPEALRPQVAKQPLPLELTSGPLSVRIDAGGITQLSWRGRELLAAPAGLVAYRQHPHDFDAWELVAPEERTPIPIEPVTARLERAGSVTVVHLEQRVGESLVDLRITLEETAPIVLVEGSVDDLERRLVIAFDVPTRLVAPVIWRQGLWGVDPIPTRPHTPIDEARFEWVAHGFADLAEGEVGLALCGGHRFGYHAQGSLVGVTLAAAPLFPDPTAQSHAAWRIGLVAHDGDWRNGRVPGWASFVRTPPVVLGRHRLGPGSARPIALAHGVRLLAAAQLQDGDGDWLVVLGEELGAARFVQVCPARQVRAAWRADYPEGARSELLEIDEHGSLRLWLRAFEVATLRLAWEP